MLISSAVTHFLPISANSDPKVARGGELPGACWKSLSLQLPVQKISLPPRHLHPTTHRQHLQPKSGLPTFGFAEIALDSSFGAQAGWYAVAEAAPPASRSCRRCSRGQSRRKFGFAHVSRWMNTLYHNSTAAKQYSVLYGGLLRRRNDSSPASLKQNVLLCCHLASSRRARPPRALRHCFRLLDTTTA